ncbi:MAG TPA: hypothetical protein VHX59_26170 [Mycobacteriales bacterium]|nr:hypothetical protein [Mycobacteriales bacterium]
MTAEVGIVGDIGDKKGKTIEVLPASDPIREPAAPSTEPAREPASPSPAR